MNRQTPLLIIMLLLAATTCWAEGYDTYIAVKGGSFFPNGRSGSATSSENGFGNFSLAYNGEVAVGIRPESYAAVELGVGYYETDASIADTAGVTRRYDAMAVPVTLTAKGILPYGRLEAFAGAGIGYWLSRLHFRRIAADGTQDAERNLNAGAFGYQLVAGADYRVTSRLDLGIEAKWSQVKPEFDFAGTDNLGKVKWEFGGTTLNAALKYRF
ncbi:outer membrane beta-barrel protein [Geomesophilobacter sediminis]|uniref:Outer membrane beta-barrel protein n=1 Tax=Geomesophilobacter sediminis TaxID=2798584 RepID=A0A8J7M0W8_9BACT|nr:outer membrane beta-barrel protein [Geomesophilobacter sediminis]MBJ6726585.1 outer membrane beta-barrel protein [Geomesophilobacter sediminis]